MTEKKVDLIINKNLTAEKFAQLVANGDIGDNELSFVNDGNEPYKGKPGVGVIALEDILSSTNSMTTAEFIEALQDSEDLPETATILGALLTTDLPDDLAQGDVVITKTTNFFGDGVFTLELSSDTVSPYKWFWADDAWQPYSGGSGGVFDLVIRTQAEFEAMIASETWLGATSVCFVGDPTPEGYVFAKSGDAPLIIPRSVFDIQGINGAVLSASSFGYEDSLLDPVNSALYHMSNIAVIPNTGGSDGAFINCSNMKQCIASVSSDCSGSTGFYSCNNLDCCAAMTSGSVFAAGFDGCRNLNNCHSIAICLSKNGGGYDSGSFGFCHCYNLSNCYGQASHDNLDMSCAFNMCTNITNCTGNSEGKGTTFAFSSCDQLVSCTGHGVSNGDYQGWSASGFWNCKQLSGCIGTGTCDADSGADGYGFYNCDYLTNCIEGEESSTTSLFLQCENVTTTSITMNGETYESTDGNIDLGNVAVIQDVEDIGTGIAIDGEYGTAFIGNGCFMSTSASDDFQIFISADIFDTGIGGLIMSGSRGNAVLSAGEMGLQQILPAENNPSPEYLATQPWVNQAIAGGSGGEFVILNGMIDGNGQLDGYTQDISPTSGNAYLINGQFGEIAIDLPTLSNGERCSFVMYVETPSTNDPEITYTSSGVTQIQGSVSFVSSGDGPGMQKILYNGYGVSSNDPSISLWYVDCSDISGMPIVLNAPNS